LVYKKVNEYKSHLQEFFYELQSNENLSLKEKEEYMEEAIINPISILFGEILIFLL